jgi:hypothetical protein
LQDTPEVSRFFNRSAKPAWQTPALRLQCAAEVIPPGYTRNDMPDGKNKKTKGGICDVRLCPDNALVERTDA